MRRDVLAEEHETPSADPEGGEGAILADICLAMADGSSEEKCLALEELASLSGEDDDTVRRTAVIMTAGLTDDDEDVRTAAFHTLLALPDASRRALSLQALGNDDPEIKLALVELARMPKDEFEMTFNFQALDAEEPAVRAAAAENLKELVGQTFDSAAAAFAWWERDSQARALAATFHAGDSCPHDEGVER